MKINWKWISIIIGLMMIGSSAALASQDEVFKCERDAEGVRFLLYPKVLKGELHIPIRGEEGIIASYPLDFEYLGDQHEPISCANLGPYLDYQLVDSPRGVDVKLYVVGGFFGHYLATVWAPELDSTRVLLCQRVFESQ